MPYTPVRPMPHPNDMHYNDGTPVRLGDRVKLGEANGIVVFIIDTDDFSPAYPASAWSYLERGLMIDTDKHGLIHHISPDEDLVFVSRAKVGQTS